MAHILDILAACSRQLIALNNDYSGTSRTRVIPSIPEFVINIVNREVLFDQSIMINATDTIIPEKPIKINIDGAKTVLYMCVFSNINRPIIDRVPIYSDSKDDHGFGVGYIVCVPKKLFEEIPNNEAIDILKKIYFGLIKLDSNMQYDASPIIIKLARSTKVKVPTYDLSICIAAVCFVYMNARMWYYDTNEVGEVKIGPKFVIDTFTDKEISPAIKEDLTRVLSKYHNSFEDIKSGIANGKILSTFLYQNKKK